MSVSQDVVGSDARSLCVEVCGLAATHRGSSVDRGDVAWISGIVAVGDSAIADILDSSLSAQREIVVDGGVCGGQCGVDGVFIDTGQGVEDGVWSVESGAVVVGTEQSVGEDVDDCRSIEEHSQ